MSTKRKASEFSMPSFDTADSDDEGNDLPEIEETVDEEETPIPIVLTSVPKLTHGREHPHWIQAMTDFKSASVYIKRVDNLCDFHDERFKDKILDIATLFPYFDYNKSLTKRCPKTNLQIPKFVPSVFQSWFAIFKAFWKFSRGEKLLDLVPLIQNNIKKWMREGPAPKQAKVFTQEQMIEIGNMDVGIDPKLVVILAAIPIQMSFSGRGCEVHNLDWEDVEVRLVVQNRKQQAKEFEEYQIWIDFMRTKKLKENDKTLIRGKVEVRNIMRYMQSFKPEEMKGRFFRYLKAKPQGDFKATNSPIGKNAFKDFGKYLADLLRLEDADNYTGHFPKRQAITAMADAGMNALEIQGQTGHKTSKIVQHYVDRSKPQKDKATAALACDGLQDEETWNNQEPTSSTSSSRDAIAPTMPICAQEVNQQQHVLQLTMFEQFQQFQRFQAMAQQTAMPTLNPQHGGNIYQFNFSGASNVSGLTFNLGSATQNQATLETGPRMIANSVVNPQTTPNVTGPN